MKAVPLDDGSAFFDLETAEEFEAKPGLQGQGVLYRTDKGHFVKYYNAQWASVSDADAFFWLLRNEHQGAAEKYLPVLWSQRQI